ncbi:Uncharacterised protein [Mycobacteroides abscessus subsp. massiliense]|nr:Uncharacterised protein [Mycobacteroides abscessus subsp. massiliense]
MRGVVVVMGTWLHDTSAAAGRSRGKAALTGPDPYPRVKRVLTYPGWPGTRTERAQS